MLNTNKLMVLIFLVLVMSCANLVSAEGLNIEIQKTSLPYSDIIEVPVAGLENQTLNVSYDDYLTGPEHVVLTGSTNTTIDVNLTLPWNKTCDDMTQQVHLSNNQTFDLVIDIVDNIKFEAAVEEYCFVGKELAINLGAPVGSILNVAVAGDEIANHTMLKTTKTVFHTATGLGEQIVQVLFTFRDITRSINLSYHVYESLKCDIECPGVVYENETVACTPVVSGGFGGNSFDWDNGDGTDSQETRLVHAYKQADTYEVELKVTDSQNYKAECSAEIDVLEHTYLLSVRVLDNETQNGLGDVNVTIGNQTRKTNRLGTARFENMLGGEYDINVSRSGYDDEKIEFMVAGDELVVINISQTPEEELPVPEVSLLYPQEGWSTDNSVVSFDFMVKSSSAIEDCMLVYNHVDHSGYKILGTKDLLKSANQYSFEATLTNGMYRWNVLCENKFGTSMNPDRNLTVFGQVEQTVPEAKVATTEPQEIVATATIDTSLFDQTLAEIEAFRKKIKGSSPDKRAVFDLIGLDAELNNNIKQIKEDKTLLISLQGLSLGETDRQLKENEGRQRLDSLRKSIPKDLLITGTENFVQNSMHNNVSYAAKEYLDWKNITLSERQFKRYVSRVEGLQDAMSVQVRIWVAEIPTLDGDTRKYGIVQKNVVQDELKGAVFLEKIDPGIAQDYTGVEFNTRYELVNDLIVHIYTQEKTEFSYYVGGDKKISDLKKSQSILLLDPNHPANEITGFSILESTSSVGGYLLIIVLISVVLVGNYLIFFRDKSYRSRVFSTVLDVKDNLTPKSKMKRLTLLLHSVVDTIKEGQTGVALAHYPQVLDLYSKVSESEQQQLQPVMIHLNHELEIFNLNRLITEAYDQTMAGQWYVALESFNQIQETVDEMPEQYHNKINTKLRSLKLAMNIHKLKTHTIKPTAGDVGVEDELFKTKK